MSDTCEQCAGAPPPDRLILTTTVLDAEGSEPFEFCSTRCLILYEGDVLELSRLRYAALRLLLHGQEA